MLRGLNLGVCGVRAVGASAVSETEASAIIARTLVFETTSLRTVIIWPGITCPSCTDFTSSLVRMTKGDKPTFTRRVRFLTKLLPSPAAASGMS